MQDLLSLRSGVELKTFLFCRSYDNVNTRLLDNPLIVLSFYFLGFYFLVLGVF